jgi:hypothetical protein
MTDEQLRSGRPWHERAKELEPEHGMWCDYAAWQEWFYAQDLGASKPADILEAMDGIDPYVFFCEVADHGYHSRDAEVARLREALSFIASQEDLTFAECSLAEEIIDRANAALSEVVE